MEALECDRCKKRIGEKKDKALAFTKARIIGEERILCVACSEKLDSFMSGRDDLRTVKQMVHPSSIVQILEKHRPASVGQLTDEELADKIIEALPNGGTF